MHIIVRVREHRMGIAMQKVIARTIAAIPIPFVVDTGGAALSCAGPGAGRAMDHP